jgi:integrase
MQAQGIPHAGAAVFAPRSISGHVYVKRGARGSAWYYRARLPHGEVRRKLGPVWDGKGRPPDGYYTRQTARAALQAILTDARRGVLPGLVRTGATVGDACDEWLRYVEEDRQRKPSTIKSYRYSVEAFFRPTFGTVALERVTTPMIEAWRREMLDGRSPRTVNKLLTELHGVFERARKVYGLPRNPVADVEKSPQRYAGDLDFYDPGEVAALVLAAETEQDGAVFLTAAQTGLRLGELLALRWADVDFERRKVHVRRSYSHGAETAPKSGRVRTVPLSLGVGQALARLGQRPHLTGRDDFVFAGETGERLDSWSLRERYKSAAKRAGLRPLRFHDLRHSFGSNLAAAGESIVSIQSYMGHADIKTTMVYMHARDRGDDADRLTAAFAVEPIEPDGEPDTVAAEVEA